MNFELEIQKHFRKAFLTSPSKTSLSTQKTTLAPAQKLLKKAILYSFKGKASHFRPRLCFETAKTLGHKSSQILPWAIALEMVHTASLVHDDMPCMDNAETRRERKCNHLIFGEDIALLTGACLFVESFSLLQDSLFNNKRTEFLELLIKTIGFHGLMSGQAMDLKNKLPHKKDILNIMSLKTGSLISACVLGPALLWTDKKEYKVLESFAENLGLAYQIADDYQDLSQDLLQDSAQQTKTKQTKSPKALSQNPTGCKKTKAEKTPLNSKKKWLYKEGILHLEKSSKALSHFKKRNKGLNSLIKEIEKRFL